MPSVAQCICQIDSSSEKMNPDSAVQTVERSREAESWSNEGVRHLNFKVILRRALHCYQAAIRSQSLSA
jgi:hypothetical protein